MFIEFPIGATIVVEEDLDGSCKKCIFDRKEGKCAFSICKVACNFNQRQDGKSIIFRLVNPPQINKEEEKKDGDDN